MGIRVGIDLGTTFCAVAMIDKLSGKPCVIRNSLGSATTPSVLYFKEDGTVLFGETAKEYLAMGENNAKAFFKRSMGNCFFAEEILGKTYTAEDLSAILLSKLKEDAESVTGEKITSAVITVPAYFGHAERSATIEAGKKAGLDVIAIINEPTAAAFAYGLNEKEGEQTVLIYDLGGGTFDVTLARINENSIKILGSDGDHELGGKEWDDCIARYLADQFLERYGVDISEDDEAASALLVTAENVKKQLTSRDQVSARLSCGGVSGRVDITEQTFEEISGYLLGTTKEITERLMESVGLDWSEVDGVILVGGSTRMRMIREYVRNMSGKEALGGVNVDEAVALGAAIRANIPDGFIGAGEKKEKRVPDGIPVIGAKTVSDATAHSLGMISISADGEAYVNSIIIKKNTRIPAENTSPFSFRTGAGANELEVYVTQGEYTRPLDNTVINKYVICGIERTSPAMSVIEVTYRYDSDSVIGVEATQKETGRRLTVRVEPVPEDMSWTDGSPRDMMLSPATCAPKVEVLLALDMSGSMSGSPLEKAKLAMKGFVDEMDPKNTGIGLIPFADSVCFAMAPTDDFQSVKSAIGGLAIGQLYGYGNRSHPFDVCLDYFEKNDANVKYLVVLTDGVWSYTDTAISAAEKCHRAGIEIMALGFGSADHNFLKKIASTDEFATLTEVGKLSGTFSRLAQVIGEGGTGITVK